jgi:hypothetical protein
VFFSFLGVDGFSGKSNVVAGLAKSIRLYLQKHAFVKVSVKGRAKGTPVAEIVQQLEVSLLPATMPWWVGYRIVQSFCGCDPFCSCNQIMC